MFPVAVAGLNRARLFCVLYTEVIGPGEQASLANMAGPPLPCRGLARFALDTAIVVGGGDGAFQAWNAVPSRQWM